MAEAKEVKTLSVPKQVVHQLAALYYYDKPKTKEIGEGDKKQTVPVQFEDLSPEDQKPFITQIAALVVKLDKCGLVLAKPPDPKTEEQKKESEKKSRAVMHTIIKNFIAGLKHPKNLQLYFNDDVINELVHRVWSGGR